MAVNAIQPDINAQALAAVQGATPPLMSSNTCQRWRWQVGGGLTVEVTANALASQYAMPLPAQAWSPTLRGRYRRSRALSCWYAGYSESGIRVCHHREGGVVPESVRAKATLHGSSSAIKAVTGLQT
ncbi:hypothetical protein [Pseudomonas peli]|uniref:hypothetical protein n=1 Tax=Pseudomonas peli TaxID=592361 RepID=UPI0024AE6D14|nr:hypothetical protein [Pseudomonas peli]